MNYNIFAGFMFIFLAVIHSFYGFYNLKENQKTNAIIYFVLTFIHLIASIATFLRI